MPVQKRKSRWDERPDIDLREKILEARKRSQDAMKKKLQVVPAAPERFPPRKVTVIDQIVTQNGEDLGDAPSLGHLLELVVEEVEGALPDLVSKPSHLCPYQTWKCPTRAVRWRFREEAEWTESPTDCLQVPAELSEREVQVASHRPGW